MFKSLFGKPKSPEDTFWNDFIARIPLLEATDNPNTIADIVGPILDKYKEGLAYELKVDDDKKGHFIISADGKKTNFASVQKLVENAPPIPNWRITPFRPRYPGAVIKFFNPPLELTDQDIFFKIFHSDEPEKVDLAVFVKGFEEDSNRLTGISFVYMDSLFGEFDIIRHIDVIEFYELPTDQNELLNSEDVLAIFDLVIYGKPLPDNFS
jgi:hypothetical protein